VTGKVETQIIDIYNRDISQDLSIHKISKILNKSYPNIYSNVTQLIDEEVLNKTHISNSFLCSINLNSPKALALLSLNEAEKTNKFLKKSPKEYQELKKLEQEFKIYTIFYSKKKLYFVLDHIHDKSAIKTNVKSLKKFDLKFFSIEDFKENILADTTLLKEKIILYQTEKYHEIVNSVMSELLGQVIFNEN